MSSPTAASTPARTPSNLKATAQIPSDPANAQGATIKLSFNQLPSSSGVDNYGLRLWKYVLRDGSYRFDIVSNTKISHIPGTAVRNATITVAGDYDRSIEGQTYKVDTYGLDGGTKMGAVAQEIATFGRTERHHDWCIYIGHVVKSANLVTALTLANINRVADEALRRQPNNPIAKKIKTFTGEGVTAIKTISYTGRAVNGTTTYDVLFTAALRDGRIKSFTAAGGVSALQAIWRASDAVAADTIDQCYW